MGSFLNPGTIEFEEALNSEIYIDKSGLIEITNAVLRTQQKFMCISRPRRFGKSMAANMLSAYYDRSVNSEHLFRHLRIHGIPSFQEHLNQYDVIKINMQDFLSLSLIHIFMKHLRQTDLRFFQVDLSALNTAHIQYIIDQREQMIAG